MINTQTLTEMDVFIHTHTHILVRTFNHGLGISGILHATVDIHFRVFTDEHGLVVYVCEI